MEIFLTLLHFVHLYTLSILSAISEICNIAKEKRTCLSESQNQQDPAITEVQTHNCKILRCDKNCYRGGVRHYKNEKENASFKFLMPHTNQSQLEWLTRHKVLKQFLEIINENMYMR